MIWWKILSLVIAGIYIVAAVFSAPKDPMEMIISGGIWLFVSLGLIWYGDELGEGLTGAKFGLISSASPGWAVAFFGWVFLLAPALLLIISEVFRIKI